LDADECIDEWDKDAFLIDDRTLQLHCRQVAGRLVSWARMAGQPFDVTPRRLANKYYKQRGRCDYIGIPLKKESSRKGVANCKNFPHEIELDHVVQVKRVKSIRSAIEGNKDEQHGMMAMMDNIRWVSRLGHVMRHFFDDKPFGVKALSRLLYTREVLGPPSNPLVSVIDQSESEKTHRGLLLDFVRSAISESRFIPYADELATKAREAGFWVEINDVWDAMKSCGVNLKTYKEDSRIAVICDWLLRNPDEMCSIETGTANISAIHDSLRGEILSAGLRNTSTVIFRSDVRKAMESLRGNAPPKRQWCRRTEIAASQKTIQFACE
jgi:hypothetical protein